MELRVNDYVRTKKGYIRKIISTDIDEIAVFVDTHTWVRKENIIKSSPNIIDLIEVGDYVNGRIVDELIYLDKLGLIGLSELEKEDEKFIKSIVTKEQFESMEYKL